MPSTSRVTCWRRTSATVRGTLMDGSGRQGPSGIHQPLRRFTLGVLPAYPVLGTTGAFFLHLVGLRRSLASSLRRCHFLRRPAPPAPGPSASHPATRAPAATGP